MQASSVALQFDSGTSSDSTEPWSLIRSRLGNMIKPDLAVATATNQMSPSISARDKETANGNSELFVRGKQAIE